LLLSLFRGRGQRRKLLFLFGCDLLRSDARPIGSSGLLLFDLLGLLGGQPNLLLLGDARFLRRGGFLLLDLLGLLGGNAGFLRRLGRRGSPCLLRLLGALGSKPRLLLLRRSRFVCG
jgi:hypothetical protein